MPTPWRLRENGTEAGRARTPVAALGQLLLLVAFVVPLAGILYLNDGRLVFALDDSYIHLALAENLARGHYGINLADYSAPSSSILWPVLIAPLTQLPHVAWWILGLNLIFASASMLIISRLLQAWLPEVPVLQIGLTTLLVLGTNVVTLTFLGMEHSLQVLVAVLVLLGLYVAIVTGNVPWWLLLGLLLGPLVRYENSALSASVGLVLFARGHRKEIVATGATVLVALLGYAAYLLSLGLSPLPSSVMAKSGLASFSTPLVGIVGNMATNTVLAFPLVVLLALLLRAVRTTDSVVRRHMAIAVAGALILHFLFGAADGIGRYEVYVLIPGLLCVVLCYGDEMREILQRQLGRTRAILLAILLASVGVLYGRPYALVPTASNSIYRQQYQMHRFVTQYYERPVAVNDLGWVSFRNDRYVLDLWGLASNEALAARRSRADPQWMDELARRHDIGLAMLYRQWFDALPAEWHCIGELRLTGDVAFIGDRTVSFYATHAAAEAPIRASLGAFVPTLPQGVEFRLMADQAGDRSGDATEACTAAGASALDIIEGADHSIGQPRPTTRSRSVAFGSAGGE